MRGWKQCVMGMTLTFMLFSPVELGIVRQTQVGYRQGRQIQSKFSILGKPVASRVEMKDKA